ncbi:MAG: nucleotidyltransferase substrate binding protein [Bacteroidales bacterium]|nr:nucleotidyltransferase substrate binding protein [Bacteroidales bacterium]
MNSPDIRWKQRFQNFNKALSYLEDALKIDQPDMIQKAGLIQFFEISFELAWKVLKDYLEEQGKPELKFPREVIKEAFQTELIGDGHAWLKALTDRNLTSHTYNEAIADEVVSEIRSMYFPMLREVRTKLNVLL